MIRNVAVSDAEKIASIYNRYIENSTVTFETNPVTPQDVSIRIREVTDSYPWIVCEESNEVIGYTYAAKWKERASYRYSVETAIYLDSEYHGTVSYTHLTLPTKRIV